MPDDLLLIGLVLIFLQEICRPGKGHLIDVLRHLLLGHAGALEDQPGGLAVLPRHDHLQQAVDVIGEADPDILLPSGGRRDRDLQMAQIGVVLTVALLSLVYLDLDAPLSVSGRAIGPLFTGREDTVALDDGGHQVFGLFRVVQGGDAQGERAHIGEDQLFQILGPDLHAGTDPRSDRDRSVRPGPGGGLPAQGLGDVPPDRRHVAGATHHHQLVQLLQAHPGIQEHLAHRGQQALEQGAALADDPLVGQGQGG